MTGGAVLEMRDISSNTGGKQIRREISTTTQKDQQFDLRQNLNQVREEKGMEEEKIQQQLNRAGKTSVGRDNTKLAPEAAGKSDNLKNKVEDVDAC
jgi:hypothetical protein